jgi:hypothetical protein
MQKSASALHELLALSDTEIDSEVSYLFVISLEWLESIGKALWHIGLAEANRSLESIITKDWHEPWNKVGLDANSLAVLDPVEIHLIVVEHLGNNDVSSCVTFLFEMLNVILSAGGLQMGLWVSSNNDTEIVSIFFFDEFD